MKSETRVSSAISRRALVAAGTGWALGAGGLLLPASGEKAAARGALGGAKGGRHGKDHRGRDKHRENNKNDNNDDEPRDQGIFQKKWIWIKVINYTSSDAILIHNPDIPSRTVKSWDEVDLDTGNTDYLFTLLAEGHNFSVQAANPDFGLPYIKIRDLTTDTLVFDESFEEGQKIDSGLFVAERFSDTDDNKVFWLGVRDYY